jgi:hypothetical protein
LHLQTGVDGCNLKIVTVDICPCDPLYENNDTVLLCNVKLTDLDCS